MFYICKDDFYENLLVVILNDVCYVFLRKKLFVLKNLFLRVLSKNGLK